MLRKKIEADVTEALKSGDRQRLSVLRNVMAEVKNLEIDKKGELNDEEVLTILRRQAKALTEAREMFVKGGRQDLVKQSDAEIALLKEYLPQELSAEELKEKVKKIVEREGGNNLGKLIGICVKELKSVAEPRRIAELVKELVA